MTTSHISPQTAPKAFASYERLIARWINVGLTPAEFHRVRCLAKSFGRNVEADIERASR